MNNEWNLPPGLSLRLAVKEDEAFLQTLFCSARPELNLLPLPPAQLSQLMRQQFELQQRGYAQQYPQAEHWIINMHSEPVGKIMCEHSQSSTHIIDFIIAPELRGRGLGRSILAALKAQTDAKVGVLSLQVDRQNINARRLYHQLGFVVSQSSDTHEFLIWS